ncbi:PDR/VanB family oxidoreductase [Advenella kashmirensis]
MSLRHLKVRVAHKSVEARYITGFLLIPADGIELPHFAPGSHIDIYLPNGITRQYSLCNNPEEPNCYRIGVLQESKSRGGSKMLCETVEEGDILEISAPKNHFPLDLNAKKSLLVAGGIGVTPILSMAEALTNSGREFEMHYAARSTDRMGFRERIQESRFAEKTYFHVDDENRAQLFDIERLLTAQDNGTHLYVCGPNGFMDAVLSTARNIGWEDARLHYEFFNAEPIDAAGDKKFQIKLAKSGKIVDVLPGQSVVEALKAEGLVIETSCEQGVCGTCLTRVLEGEPIHRDLFLTPEEQAQNDCFLPCCSWSNSSLLVLDL